jgi:hypothetical protein
MMLGFWGLWIPTVAQHHFLMSNCSLDILYVTGGGSFQHVCRLIMPLVELSLSFFCADNQAKAFLRCKNLCV